jgi:hypothetical protein
MKKVNVFLTGVFFILISFGTNAQTQPSVTGETFFIGKWYILAKGTPQGDTKMVLTVEKKDGKLTGNLNDTTSTDGLREFTSITIKETTLSAVFSAQGMDIPLDITKKDEKSITGNIMGMFDIEGSRVN